MAPICASNRKDPGTLSGARKPWWLVSPIGPPAQEPETLGPPAAEQAVPEPQVSHLTPLDDRQAWANGDRRCHCGRRMEPAMDVGGWRNFDCPGCGHVVPVKITAVVWVADAGSEQGGLFQ